MSSLPWTIIGDMTHFSIAIAFLFIEVARDTDSGWGYIWCDLIIMFKDRVLNLCIRVLKYILVPSVDRRVTLLSETRVSVFNNSHLGFKLPFLLYQLMALIFH
jgi:hypothetical protein